MTTKTTEEMRERVLQSSDKYSRELGKKIRAIRESKGMTREQVSAGTQNADTQPISVLTIANIEHGRHCASHYNVYRVANAMGLTPFQLVTWQAPLAPASRQPASSCLSAGGCSPSTEAQVSYSFTPIRMTEDQPATQPAEVTPDFPMAETEQGQVDPQEVQGSVANDMLANSIFAARGNIKSNVEYIKGLIKEMKNLSQSDVEPSNKEADFSEMIASATLAMRHLEDAAMRLGKVMQAKNGGQSILSK